MSVQSPRDELPVTIDLKKYHGDTWTQPFRLKDGDTPHPLEDAEILASVRGNGITTSLDVSLGDTGEFTLHPPVEGLHAGQYLYDVQVTEDGSTITWIRGSLHIRQDVTDG